MNKVASLLALSGVLVAVGSFSQPPSPASGDPTALQLTPSERQQIERSRDIKPLVDDFVKLMYVDRKGHDAFEKYVAENLVEHDPDSMDGRESIFKFMKKRFDG